MPAENDKLKVECPTCLGCGRVDDKEGKPWCEVNRVPNEQVRRGFIQPKHCPQCHGFGNVEAPQPKVEKPAPKKEAPKVEDKPQ